MMTTRQVAERIGVTPRRVLQIAEDIGIRPIILNPKMKTWNTRDLRRFENRRTPVRARDREC